MRLHHVYEEMNRFRKTGYFTIQPTAGAKVFGCACYRPIFLNYQREKFLPHKTGIINKIFNVCIKK
jgi:hypothetical protein